MRMKFVLRKLVYIAQCLQADPVIKVSVKYNVSTTDLSLGFN